MSKEKEMGIYFKNNDFIRLQHVIDFEFTHDMLIIKSYNTSEKAIAKYREDYLFITSIEKIVVCHD